MTPAVAATHSLSLWADDQKVATLGYEPLNDRWSLDYEYDWVNTPDSFPLSPPLPLEPPAQGYAPGAVKRFVENLLPEGRVLDISATTYHVSKSNVFGLINALGAETAGALRFWRSDQTPPSVVADAPREVTQAELSERLATRNAVPFVVWDGKVRMSIAGYQDKLLVYLDKPLGDGGRMYLPDPPLASTHILKPDPMRSDMPHVAVNEHFCMSLARRMGLPVADVDMLRAPKPLLVVTRFDRAVVESAKGLVVRRLHIIDAVQASDLPVTYKYERNFGNGEQVRNIREGVSFEVLFDRVEQTVNKAAARLAMLRWALFQFLIGNSDAHGKNFSFFVRQQGLQPAPWYDLLSVVQYPGIDHELAMAFGDAFTLEEVTPFALADFAKRCNVDRRLLKREALRMTKLATEHTVIQAEAEIYLDDERAFARQLRDYIASQAQRLATLAGQAVGIKDAFL